MAPDDRDADDVDEGDQQYLRQHRMAQPIGGLDGSLELGRRVFGNQLAFLESLQQGTQRLCTTSSAAINRGIATRKRT
jgi:hypothetical protein